MAASNTDKFKKAKRRFSTTVGVGGATSGDTTIPLTSTTGLDTDTAITLVLDPGLATEEVITGVVSGTDIINSVRGKESTTAQAHTAGAAVAMYFTETHWDDLIDGVLAQHTQTGTHGAITATSVAATTSVTAASVAATTSVTVAGTSVVAPAAAIMQYAGSTAPTGWLLADGTAVSRTTYAALFAIVATSYGVGDGSTTFNLPNLKGRVPVGRDAAQTEFDVLAETGGAKTHTLTAAQMPSHSHGGSASAPYTTAAGGNNTGSGIPPHSGFSSGNSWGGSIGTDAQGGGTAHNILQPYIVLNYIIKT